MTTNDQLHIYIQTPSVDPADTNKVWQDMFTLNYADFGFPAGPSGPHIFGAQWPGVVPLDGSVKFAALDSQDRDFDGLQDGYEILSTHTVAGAPDSDLSGLADGDKDIGQDNLSNAQKWSRGLNPLVSASTNSLAGNGLPDWFTNYITFWYGGGTGAWDDPDGDQVPNLVEYDLGLDPVVQDYWGALPPPPGDESQQFVSIQINNVSYSDDDGPYYTDTNGTPHGKPTAADSGINHNQTAAASQDYILIQVKPVAVAGFKDESPPFGVFGCFCSRFATPPGS